MCSRAGSPIARLCPLQMSWGQTWAGKRCIDMAALPFGELVHSDDLMLNKYNFGRPIGSFSALPYP